MLKPLLDIHKSVMYVDGMYRDVYGKWLKLNVKQTKLVYGNNTNVIWCLFGLK